MPKSFTSSFSKKGTLAKSEEFGWYYFFSDDDGEPLKLVPFQDSAEVL